MIARATTDWSTEGGVRYGWCWEDAQVMRDGLALEPGARVLSIGAAGDNVLALLLDDPSEVVAVDTNPAQLACLELRIAAFRVLAHGEMLTLLGARPGANRAALYARVREDLSTLAQTYWDARVDVIARGDASYGRLERYFTLFRRGMLPLVHSRRRVQRVLQPAPQAERARTYDRVWDTARWRAVFRLFFSRPVMAALGRSRTQVSHAEGDIGSQLLLRARAAMVTGDPSQNPFVSWILTGTYGDALPVAFRPEHFDTIRQRLDRIQLRRGTVEDVLATDTLGFDGFNLSDIFESVPPQAMASMAQHLVDSARAGARVVSWNLLAPRRLADHHRSIRRLDALSDALHARDCGFFYRAVHVEEVR